jgi:hypothetical protein
MPSAGTTMFFRPSVVSRTAGLSLAPLLLVSLAAAQTGEPPPLFAGAEPLNLTLEIPLRRLVARAGSRPKLDGTLVTTGSETPRFDVEISTRGKSRLEYCSFPPLNVNLKRGQVPGTLFAEQNRLKLVTRCRSGREFEEYLEIEYVLYRVYAEVSEYAYRVRPLHMTYVDSERDNAEEAPAFFIEDDDSLAERLGLEVAKVEHLDIADLRRDAVATLGLFQFLIGNTDWSALAAPRDEDACCHNGDVFVADGQYIVVPYDFDQAGIIDTSYAAPAAGLSIRTVRQRLYRGFCVTNPLLEDTIQRFNAARPTIEGYFNAAQLQERTRQKALEYVADFYAIVNDPGERARKITSQCRGN